MVVEEVVHQDLAVLEDRHASVHRLDQYQPSFVHVDACHVVSKNGEPVKRGLDTSLRIFSVSQSLTIFKSVRFLSFSIVEHRVVHYPLEVCFKIAFCLLAKFGVHPDVWFHP